MARTNKAPCYRTVVNMYNSMQSLGVGRLVQVELSLKQLINEIDFKFSTIFS